MGWASGLVGNAIVDTGVDSQAGYTLNTDQPVVVGDLATEERFNGPPLLRDHGVVSGMSVIIHGTDRTYGVLGAHTTARRSFTRDDVNFLQAVATFVAHVLERTKVARPAPARRSG